MLKIQSPLAGSQIQRPKSGRKPLQPKNFPANPIGNHVKPKPKPERIEISLIDNWNKENHPPTKIESLDASLAEELSAIREKLERLRIDKEKTQKMLKERDLMLEMNMKELEKRGEMQKQLEIEVDRLFRLKELKSSCMRISSNRTLREKQHERKIKEDQFQDTSAEYIDESKDESVMQSPSLESLMQSPSSDIDTEK